MFSGGLDVNFSVLRAFFLIFLCFFVGCGEKNAAERENIRAEVPETDENFTQIVSLSPAITEMIYALGREDRLIGVTKFCKFPPEAQQKTLVGGYYDVNRELLMKLRPEVVLVPVGENEVLARVEGVGLRTLAFDLRTVAGVYDSIRRLGEMLDARAEAAVLVEDLESRMETLRQNAAKMFPVQKRVLFVVGRNYTAHRPEDVFITGNDGFCNALLAAAGGENVYRGNTPFPKISTEGLLIMNPDMIVESVPTALRQKQSDAEILRAWQTLDVKAVRDGRILLMDDDPPLIPGISMVAWAEKLQRWMLEMEK